MKNTLILLTILSAMLLASCDSSNTSTQNVPDAPGVVEPQTWESPFEDGDDGEQSEQLDEVADGSSELGEVEADADAVGLEEMDTSDVDLIEVEGETSSTSISVETNERETTTTIIETNDTETTTTTTTTTGSTSESTTADSGTATSSTSESTTADSGTATSSTSESNSADSGTATSSASESVTADSGTATSSTSESVTANSSSTITQSSTVNPSTSVDTTVVATATAEVQPTVTQEKQTINSYVEFYVVDMQGKPVSGVSTKFGTLVPSATTDSTGKTKTQLTSDDLGRTFNDLISITHSIPFKANISILNTANASMNMSLVENSTKSLLTQLSTVEVYPVDENSTITVANNQTISVIVMMDYANATTPNTTGSNNTDSVINDPEINGYITLSLDDITTRSHYGYDNYSRDYNKSKVEVELLSKNELDSKMVTIYEGDKDFGINYNFLESHVEWKIGSLIVLTLYHPFEVELEFDRTLWREDRSRALSTPNGDGTHSVYLHDIVDKVVDYGRQFHIHMLIDNRGAGSNY